VPVGPLVCFSTFSTGTTSPTLSTWAGRPGKPPTRWSGRVGRAHCISANGMVPSPPLPSELGSPAMVADCASTLVTTASCQVEGPNSGRRWTMRLNSSSHAAPSFMSAILAHGPRQPWRRS
jgi:hypothetical protein